MRASGGGAVVVAAAASGAQAKAQLPPEPCAVVRLTAFATRLPCCVRCISPRPAVPSSLPAAHARRPSGEHGLASSAVDSTARVLLTPLTLRFGRCVRMVGGGGAPLRVRTVRIQGWGIPNPPPTVTYAGFVDVVYQRSPKLASMKDRATTKRTLNRPAAQ